MFALQRSISFEKVVLFTPIPFWSQHIPHTKQRFQSFPSCLTQKNLILSKLSANDFVFNRLRPRSFSSGAWCSLGENCTRSNLLWRECWKREAWSRSLAIAPLTSKMVGRTFNDYIYYLITVFSGSFWDELFQKDVIEKPIAIIKINRNVGIPQPIPSVAATFIISRTPVIASHPWSKNWPRGDEFPVRRAWRPSRLSRVW